MWVLIMLISFLMAEKNKKKLIFLGSLFIFVSAFVYFLFMVAWLNFLLFIGYLYRIKFLVGIIAVIGGLFYIKEFFKNKEGVCTVTSEKSKKKVFEKLQYFTSQKKIYLAAFGIILLAFFVNLIELVCSAGIPIVYLQILTLSKVSFIKYYMYILLYIFVFMLDDLLIFFVAIFSLRLLSVTTKYSRFSHIIGGLVLLIIGILLIFKPEMLMFGSK